MDDDMRRNPNMYILYSDITRYSKTNRQTDYITDWKQRRENNCLQ